MARPDATIELGVEGIYDFRVYKANADGTAGALVRELCDVGNLITNVGMDYIGQVASSPQGWLQCVVGTGNAAPAFTDTQLVNAVASSSTQQAISIDRSIAASPRWVQLSKTWRFAAGAAAGNLSEVGVRHQAANPQTLISRALIVDAGGNPTTLTVLSDEILDVTYRQRWFVPESDVTGQITLNGTTHSWTLRAVAINQAGGGSNPGWPAETASAIQNFGPRALAVNNTNTNATTNCVATVGMVAIDQVPVLTGLPDRGTASGSNQYAAYTPGSYFLDSVLTWGLSNGNGSGIQLVVLSSVFGSFQIGFSPAFTKLNTQQLRFTLRVSWARRT